MKMIKCDWESVSLGWFIEETCLTLQHKECIAMIASSSLVPLRDHPEGRLRRMQCQLPLCLSSELNLVPMKK